MIFLKKKARIAPSAELLNDVLDDRFFIYPLLEYNSFVNGKQNPAVRRA